MKVHSSKLDVVTIPETQRLERDGGHTASSSGMDYPGAVTVPDFTPFRNGKGCVYSQICGQMCQFEQDERTIVDLGVDCFSISKITGAS